MTPSIRFQRILPLAVFASAVVLVAASRDAAAQQGYGSYYGKQYQKSGGQLGKQSPTTYLYDKYFYHRPSVSPYANIDRYDTMSGTSYQAYVRPEQERRQATAIAQAKYIDARKREGKVGETRYPGATFGGSGTALMKPVQSKKSTPSAYYNHWYGGWQNR